MIRDNEYKYLSEETYDIEKDKLKFRNNGELEFYSRKYKILALEDNQNNGMQAVAVAPVNDREEVDTRRIVIA